MADLSLKIAVKLLTKNFHQGVNSLKGSLRSLQMQFIALSGAMGAGSIGITNLISRMREIAKETSQVNIALKNVSGTTAAFADNQKWLLSVANKYGVQINTLTNGFTKFKAAADIANMSVDDQRKIFESVSRASVAYGLSAEDQRGVFLALAQMMSKGKVMAEELRLQMAERLPVAIQAMAKALGVSVNEMDALMKQGKVMSSDVLPKFAEALTELIPNVDLDNLSKSLSVLSNKFVKLTKAFDVKGKYKSLVDALGSALGFLAERAEKVAGAIRVAFESILALKAINIFKGFAADTEQEISAAKALIGSFEQKVVDTNKKRKELAAARVAYNKALNAQEVLSANATEDEKVRAARRADSAERALAKKQDAYNKSLSAAKTARAKVDAETRAKAEFAAAGTIKKGFVGIAAAARRAGLAIKAAFSATVVTALITGLVEVVRYLAKAYSEARQIKKLADETRAAIEGPIEISSQEQDLTSNLKILQSSKSLENQRIGALQKINSLLGTEYKISELTNETMRDINDKAARYIKYLEAQNRLEIAKTKHQENKAKFDALVQQNAPSLSSRGVMRGKSDEQIATYIRNNPEIVKGGTGIVNALVAAENGLEQWSKVVAKYSNEFDYLVKTPGESPGGRVGAELTVDGKESELSKAQKKYADALAELEAELGAQMITEREYTRKKRDLIEESYLEALSGGDADILSSSYFGNLARDFESFAHGDLRKRQEEVEDMLAEYRDNLAKLNRQHASGAFNAEAYGDAMRELAAAFVREAGAIDLSNLPEDIAREIASAIQDAGGTAIKYARSYEPMERDNRTWDMSLSDQVSEELASSQHYLDYLRDLAVTTAQDMSAEINAQLATVDSLKDALKLAEAKEAVEELNRAMREGSWDGIQKAMSNLDNIVSSVERVSEVLNDTDASGWEKFMAIWEAMASMIDGIVEMVSMMETMKKVSESLTKAKEAENAANSVGAQEVIQNISKEMAASNALAATETSNATSVIGAKTGEAIATGTAQGAKAGWPALLFAIPAALAAVMAGLALIPKFEKGGVVGGNSISGDKILARLNSGEGVLTQRGMANLGGLAASSASNVRVTGQLKARGRDLLVVLEEEKRYQKRVG